MTLRDPRLLGSLGSLEGIVAIINRYFCAASKKWSVKPETLEVIDGDGQVRPRYMVRKKGRRYRFERIAT